MRFELYPITLNYWGNYFMTKWDSFSTANPFQFGMLVQEMPGDIPLFKSDRVEDYQRFRGLMQILDMIVLDLNSFRFDKKHITASAIYFQLGLFYRVFNREQISGMDDIQTLIISLE